MKYLVTECKRFLCLLPIVVVAYLTPISLYAIDIVTGENLVEIVKSIQEILNRIETVSHDAADIIQNAASSADNLDSHADILNSWVDDLIDQVDDIDYITSLNLSRLDMIEESFLDTLEQFEGVEDIFAYAESNLDILSSSSSAFDVLLSYIPLLDSAFESLESNLDFIDFLTDINEQTDTISIFDETIDTISSFDSLLEQVANQWSVYDAELLEGLEGLQGHESSLEDIESNLDDLYARLSSIDINVNELIDEQQELDNTIANIKHTTSTALSVFDSIHDTKHTIQSIIQDIVPIAERLSSVIDNLDEVTSTIGILQESIFEEVNEAFFQGLVTADKLEDITLGVSFANIANTITGIRSQYEQLAIVFKNLDEDVSHIDEVSTTVNDRIYTIFNDTLDNFDLMSRIDHLIEEGLTIAQEVEQQICNIGISTDFIEDELQELVAKIASTLEVQEILEDEFDEVRSRLEELDSNLKSTIQLNKEVVGQAGVMHQKANLLYTLQSSIDGFLCDIQQQTSDLEDLFNMIAEDAALIDAFAASNIDDLESSIECITTSIDNADTLVHEYNQPTRIVESVIDAIESDADFFKNLVFDAFSRIPHIEQDLRISSSKFDHVDIVTTDVLRKTDNLDDTITELTDTAHTIASSEDTICSIMDDIAERDINTDEILTKSRAVVRGTQKILTRDLDIIHSIAKASSKSERRVKKIHPLWVSIYDTIMHAHSSVQHMQDLADRANEQLKSWNESAHEAQHEIIEAADLFDGANTLLSPMRVQFLHIFDSHFDVLELFDEIRHDGHNLEPLVKKVGAKTKGQFDISTIVFDLIEKATAQLDSINDQLNLSTSTIDIIQQIYGDITDSIFDTTPSINRAQESLFDVISSIQGLLVHSDAMRNQVLNVQSVFDNIRSTIDEHDDNILDFVRNLDDVTNNLVDIIERNERIEIEIGQLNASVGVLQDIISLLLVSTCDVLSLTDVTIPVYSRIDSILNQVESTTELIEDKISEIDSVAMDLEVRTMNIRDDVQEIESTLEELASQTEEIVLDASQLDVHVDLVQSGIEVAQSSIDAITSNVEVLISHVESLIPQISGLDSGIDVIASIADSIFDKVCMINDIADAIESTTSIIESTLDSTQDIFNTITNELAELLALHCSHTIVQSDIPFTITTPGVYCVGEPLDFVPGSPVITVSNVDTVLLNLNGFGVISDVASDGILLSNVTNITVQEGFVKGGIRAVAVENSNGVIARDLDFVGPTNVGMQIINSTNVECVNCISNATPIGFQMLASNRVVFKESLARVVDIGFSLESTNQSCCIECKVASFTQNAFFDNGVGNIFISCIAQGGGLDAFVLTGSSYVVRDSAVLTSQGGYVMDGDLGVLRNAIAIATDTGVAVMGSSNGVLSNYLSGISAGSSVGITDGGTNTRVFNNMVLNTMTNYVGVPPAIIELAVTTSTRYWTNV